MTQYSHYEAASINVKGALERLVSIPNGPIPTHQITGDAAMIQATAACATAQALLAINETLIQIHNAIKDGQ